MTSVAVSQCSEHIVLVAAMVRAHCWLVGYDAGTITGDHNK